MARCNRERSNILENLTNQELVMRYRLNREGVYHVNNLIGNVLQPSTKRSNSLSSIEKILISLRFLASGTFQLNHGDMHSVSQPTVSRAITEFISAMTEPELIKRYIKLPQSEDDVRRTCESFYGLGGFPNVFGAIDGTQVQIQAPHHEESVYVNRMGYHSINTQNVCDAEGKIMNIVANWPGSTHDSRVLRQSCLFEMMERGMDVFNGKYLLGDSGYPCKRWLMTPYLHPQGVHQSDYNKAHKKRRSIVERCIGQLKRRFGVLHGEIRLQPEKACRVIVSCAMLHNLCKEMNLLENIDDLYEENDENNIYNAINGNEDGLRFRDMVAQNYF